jgi:tetratricopeptide (TPR) repeat protein
MRGNTGRAGRTFTVRHAGRKGPRRMGVCATCAVVALLAGCATRAVAPALPAALPYPEFVYPALPAAYSNVEASAQMDRGWRYLQNNDFGNAEREFAAAVQRTPGLYPAQAGTAYVALARGNHEQALSSFDAALAAAPAYVPALVGRGQTLLALKRETDALAAFEAALTADPSLADVRRRADVLRFRNLQDVIEAARTAAAAGRLPEARDAYQRAIQASPESAFLHRELGLLERKQGAQDAALDRFRRAIELDSADAVSLVQMGELFEERRDFESAEAAYRKAADIEPSADLTARMAAIAERAREARLPPEFQLIADVSAITRGELAALVGVRLEDVVRAAPTREVVMTDAQGHWAAPWITQVATASVMDPYPNHTFQPGERITRGDLAALVSVVIRLLAADRRPDLRTLQMAQRPQIADMAPGHLSYPAVSDAVASGVMPLVDGRFEAARAVSGVEAAETIARLRALAGPAR